ncbi:UGPA uridylyltransferase, partial [Polypterus senegalus]|nr:UGPA uridylyltransferase [Polypterus senegalus]
MAGFLCDSEIGCHSPFCTELPVSIEMEMESLLEKTAPEEAQVLRDDWKKFQQLYKQFIQRERPTSVWEKICKPPAETIQAYESLCMKPLPTDVSSLLEKLVVLKLNGGLGTYMGVPGPKGLMNIRDKNNFLDFTVQQIEHLNQTYGSDVPLVLMNSPFTDEETQQSLQKYSKCPIHIHTFVHSRFPPLHKDTRLPMLSLENWFLSGHGDVYASLCHSGLIELFLAQGKEILFISNIDNLGATVDLHILSEMLHRDLQNPETTCDFLMEVTDRTQADSKILPGGQDIIRLETAAGSAIGSFSHPRGVNVPRSRFLPVKTTSDLLLVKSNLYHLCNGSFILCEEREFDTIPLVKLGTHFSKVRDLQIRFENIPNVVELDHLTVSGDVTFGKDVVLKLQDDAAHLKFLRLASFWTVLPVAKAGIGNEA